MFKMRRNFMILCQYRPAIIEMNYIFYTQVYHGLNSQHHSFFQFSTGTFFPVVRYLWIFMHFSAKSMPYQFPHNTITIFFFCMLLYSVCNITDPVSLPGFLNTYV